MTPSRLQPRFPRILAFSPDSLPEAGILFRVCIGYQFIWLDVHVIVCVHVCERFCLYSCPKCTCVFVPARRLCVFITYILCVQRQHRHHRAKTAAVFFCVCHHHISHYDQQLSPEPGHHYIVSSRKETLCSQSSTFLEAVPVSRQTLMTLVTMAILGN